MTEEMDTPSVTPPTDSNIILNEGLVCQVNNL